MRPALRLKDLPEKYLPRQVAAGRHIHEFPGAAHSDLLGALPMVPDRFLLRSKRSPLWLTPALGHTYDHLAELERAV